MKVAVFSARSYDREFLTTANAPRDEIYFFEVHLNETTANLAAGFDAVCVFVNDHVNAAMIAKLVSLDIRLIALRCAGYNNIDLPQKSRLQLAFRQNRRRMENGNRFMNGTTTSQSSSPGLHISRPGSAIPATASVAAQREVDSFYHLSGCSLSGKACRGTACFAARHLNPERWAQAVAQDPRLYCLGKCFVAPSIQNGEPRPTVEIHSRKGIALERLVRGGARTLRTYGGYHALEKVLGRPRDEIVDAVEISGLRGRGGAGFPTGKKWRAVAQQDSAEKFVVANADEGDPGAYIDRFLIEDDPHALIEGMLLAGYAVDAHKGCIYLRKEYPRAEEILRYCD